MAPRAADSADLTGRRNWGIRVFYCSAPIYNLCDKFGIRLVEVESLVASIRAHAGADAVRSHFYRCNVAAKHTGC